MNDKTETRAFRISRRALLQGTAALAAGATLPMGRAWAQDTSDPASLKRSGGTVLNFRAWERYPASDVPGLNAFLDANPDLSIEWSSAPFARYRDRLIAEFIGGINLFEGRVLSHDAATRTARIACDAVDGGALLARHADPLPEGTAVSVAVRPEKIDVHESRPHADNVAVGKVRDIAYLGDVSIYHVETESGAVIRVQETHVERSSEPHYDWGETLWLSWPASGAVVLAT